MILDPRSSNKYVLVFLETELFLKLQEHANTLVGADAYCFKAFAEALEVIPYTLAENAGYLQGKCEPRI